jgi:THO complex subunit 1
MLQLWFDDDVDASLDNLGYYLEGLIMIAAADAVKRICEPADKMEDISE